MEVRIEPERHLLTVPAVVAVGFGTTVAMWAVGYFGRLPATMLPGPLMIALFLGCLVVGGSVIGRWSGGGPLAGGLAGAISGLLNLLVLLSFLAGERPNQMAPSAAVWIPGSVLLSGGLAAAGAALAGRARGRPLESRDWLGAFVKVSVVATLLLLAVGGLVTSAEAGLAVVDWPQSFGYNMFLYPFSRMTGGIYFEHAHRLFGALVGLTTLVLALFLQRVEPRRWVRGVGWLALALVVAQGVLGGLRVTERSPVLAAVHGVLGQVFFSTLVGLAAVTSRVWRHPGKPVSRHSAGTDRILGATLVALMLGQLVLGALQRHLSQALIFHIATGVALVAPLALLVGVRAWGLNEGQKPLQRLGLLLVVGVAVQVVLGFAAWAVTGAVERGRLSGSFDLVVTTSHQWFGAILMATAVGLLCLDFRLLDATKSSHGGAVGGSGLRSGPEKQSTV